MDEVHQLTDPSRLGTAIAILSRPSLTMSPSIPHSRDGWEWTEQQGLRQGVPSISVIHPPSNVSSANVVYDAIVVGAGYAGLTALRDTALAGKL